LVVKLIAKDPEANYSPICKKAMPTFEWVVSIGKAYEKSLVGMQGKDY